jgi:large subunit ribosomal protein L14
MKAILGKRVRALNVGSLVNVADNSGARVVKIIGVKKGKTVKGRQMACGISDWVKVSVRKGDPELKSQVFDAVVVRQRKPYRRLTGERICFNDNAVILLKDNKGNPKGTMVKGAVAREVVERWPHIAKIVSLVV